MSISLTRSGSAISSQCPSPQRPGPRSLQERSGGNTPRCGSPTLLRSAPQSAVAAPQLVTWCGRTPRGSCSASSSQKQRSEVLRSPRPLSPRTTPRCTTPSRSSRCEGLAQTPRGPGHLRRQSGVVRGSSASDLKRCTSAGSRLAAEAASPPYPQALVGAGYSYTTSRSVQCLSRVAPGSSPCMVWGSQGADCMMQTSPPQLRRSADHPIDAVLQDGTGLWSVNSSPAPQRTWLNGRHDKRLDTCPSSSSSHSILDDRLGASKAGDAESRSSSSDSRRPTVFGPPLASLRSRSPPHVGPHRNSRPFATGSARVTPVPSPQLVSEDRAGCYLEAAFRTSSERCPTPEAERWPLSEDNEMVDEGHGMSSSSLPVPVDADVQAGKAAQPQRWQPPATDHRELEVPTSSLIHTEREEGASEHPSEVVSESRQEADAVHCSSEQLGGKQAERALRRAADLARRAAEAVAKAESVKVCDAIGDSLPSIEEPNVNIGSKRTTTNGVVSRASLGRQAALPQVHEDRSTEFDFSITFLLPQGVEGEEFMETVLLAFPEGHFDVASQCSFALVPYGGDKTAMVALHRLGPVEALEQARRYGPARAQSKGLPETVDEMGAKSTAIVYVVHSFHSAEDAEQQLGPICSVEASYRVAAKKHQPRRFIAALHDADDAAACKEEEMGRSGPLGCEVLKKLQARAVAPLPCSAVTRGSLYRHERLVVQIVEALAAHFRPDRFDNRPRDTDQPSAFGTSASVVGGKEKDVCSLVGSETTAGSSFCTTPQTSPPGSLSTTAKPQGQCEL